MPTVLTYTLQFNPSVYDPSAPGQLAVQAGATVALAIRVSNGSGKPVTFSGFRITLPKGASGNVLTDSGGIDPTPANSALGQPAWSFSENDLDPDSLGFVAAVSNPSTYTMQPSDPPLVFKLANIQVIDATAQPELTLQEAIGGNTNSESFAVNVIEVQGLSMSDVVATPPQTGAPGTEAALSWQSNGVTEGAIFGVEFGANGQALTTEELTDGQVSVYPQSTEIYTIRLGDGGNVQVEGQAEVLVAVPAILNNYLEPAPPAPVSHGTTVTIYYTVENADTLSLYSYALYGDQVGVITPIPCIPGTPQQYPVTPASETLYTLQASNSKDPNAPPAQWSFQINVSGVTIQSFALHDPTTNAVLTAPALKCPGLLEWQTENAINCTLDLGDGSDPVTVESNSASYKSENLPYGGWPITVKTTNTGQNPTYTLTANDPYGNPSTPSALNITPVATTIQSCQIASVQYTDPQDNQPYSTNLALIPKTAQWGDIYYMANDPYLSPSVTVTLQWTSSCTSLQFDQGIGAVASSGTTVAKLNFPSQNGYNTLLASIHLSCLCSGETPYMMSLINGPDFLCTWDNSTGPTILTIQYPLDLPQNATYAVWIPDSKAPQFDSRSTLMRLTGPLTFNPSETSATVPTNLNWQGQPGVSYPQTVIIFMVALD